jgi:hypothetical protein|tara:strand:+ start:517 stop:720 length:204 start_codon:yes stop_codon:yes gene_type:complete
MLDSFQVKLRNEKRSFEMTGEEHLNNCHCDECEGACSNGRCGNCFACEDKADNEKFWQANKADILGL